MCRYRSSRRRSAPGLVIAAMMGGLALVLSACSAEPGTEISLRLDSTAPNPPGTAATQPAHADPAAEPTDERIPTEEAGTSVAAEPSDGTQAEPTTTQPQSDVPQRPDWLGTRVLPTTPAGNVPPQTTPPELVDRRLQTIDTLPPPSDFTSSIGLLVGEPLERSTWIEGCPVAADDLRYITVSFWGFDGRPHRGELILHADVAEQLVTVFQTLYEARFPIEEMRIVTQADVDAPPTGDGNNTSSFVCRAVTGGSRFSEHAYGLAIDINPFHNPYIKGDVTLPELATVYNDRSQVVPGKIVDGDVVVSAFDDIGWGWGGRWNSLKDYQHFALNDR